ncbi:MAG TPA: energy-coupling factor ABC transporter permease [Tepidisphaeraceae bacterium]|jgi:cobalt/nickel transport system permease protein
MHIPDGFLDARTAATAAALSIGGLGLAVRRARVQLPARKVPLMGLAAAFVFAGQMLNFPVAGGTSGHLVGGVLCGVLLGPSAAVLVISCVLIVQCLAFGDGGVLALGANIFNMAIVSAVGGYAIYRGLHRIFPGERGRLLAVAVASWAATVAAAVVCAGQLALSGTAPWSVTLPAMAWVHMLIGVGEAIITTLVVASIARSRPELLDAARPAPSRGAELLLFGGLIALGLALFVAPFASALPDGLDHAATLLGFAARERHVLAKAPLAEYHLPGVQSPALATALAGGIGTVLMFAIAWAMARLLVRAERNGPQPTEAPGA